MRNTCQKDRRRTRPDRLLGRHVGPGDRVDGQIAHFDEHTLRSSARQRYRGVKHQLAGRGTLLAHTGTRGGWLRLKACGTVLSLDLDC